MHIWLRFDQKLLTESSTLILNQSWYDYETAPRMTFKKNMEEAPIDIRNLQLRLRRLKKTAPARVDYFRPSRRPFSNFLFEGLKISILNEPLPAAALGEGGVGGREVRTPTTVSNRPGRDGKNQMRFSSGTEVAPCQRCKQWFEMSPQLLAIIFLF